MSVPAGWLDPGSGDPGDRQPSAAEQAQREARAARADAAAIAARAASVTRAAAQTGRQAAATAPPVADPVAAPPVADLVAASRPAGALTLAAGVLGRVILSFVTGCLVISLLPLLFGWHPYVVKSGSMEPRIKVGDVILSSPDRDPSTLLGHVTVFEDPARPGTVKSHRIIAVNPDGTLVSKGDANPTPDPVPVTVGQVHGIGRLLVRWAGLPVIWARTGQLPFLGLFLLVLVAASWAVARDIEDEADPLDSGDSGYSGDSGDSGEADGDRPEGDRATRGRAERRLRTARRRRTVATRSVASVAGLAVLLVPGASAAFSATTRTTGSSWTVPAYSYPTTVKSFATPYLYWQLGDTGSTAADASGNSRTGTYAGTYTRSVTGGTPQTTPNAAVTATTSSSCITTTSTTAVTAPTTFTEVIWFKTAAGYTGGGKLIGFESPRTGVGVAGVTGSYDRQIYLDGAGKVWFGVFASTYVGIGSTGSYNDGSWHMAAATLSSGGIALYVDGVLRASSANTVAESTSGWWRVGCGNLAGWGGSWNGPNNPGTSDTAAVNVPFLGSLDEATVYSGTALSASNVSLLYWTR